MLITQTPYRVSFAGGGTDLSAFYAREYGAVLSAALNMHMYVTVSPRFNKTLRVSYTTTEICEDASELQHELVREALVLTRLNKYIEITTIGDLPGGTGLGSSSSLTVGLLQALYAFRGEVVPTYRLAEEACQIEIDILGKPIGKQDQFAAAFGGLNYIRFEPSGSVHVEPVPCRHDVTLSLQQHMLMFYTEKQRSAGEILKRQSAGTEEKLSTLRQMRDLADRMRMMLTASTDICDFGELLHEGWELKRSLGFGISNEAVDDWYSRARKAGALGGKLLGAGGGGFLLLFVPPEYHDAVRQALNHPREIGFEIDPRGSRITFVSEHQSLSRERSKS